MATVVTGCLMLKLERNMASTLCRGRTSRRRRWLGSAVVGPAWPSFSVAFGIAQHLVAFGEARLHRVRAGARIAIAERQRDLLQLVVLHAPRERVVALAHHRCGWADVSAAVLRVSMRPSAYRPATFGCCFASSKPTSTSTWRVVTLAAGFTRVTLPVNSRSAKPWMRNHTCWPGLHLADAVGRHQSFETQAGRIDDLDQLLADLRRVARRHLAVADDAVERRAHLGALELLARGHDARARGFAIALRGVAADLDVFDLLGRHHAGLAQRCSCAGTGARPARRPARRRASTPRPTSRLSRIEVWSRRTSRSPRFTGSPFSLSTASTTAGHFGAQVGATLGLDRAGDGRPGGQRVAAHRQHVFCRDQQRGEVLFRRCIRALAATGQGEKRKSENREEAEPGDHSGFTNHAIFLFTTRHQTFEPPHRLHVGLTNLRLFLLNF